MRSNGDMGRHVRQRYNTAKSRPKHKDTICSEEEWVAEFWRQYNETGGRCPKTGIKYDLANNSSGASNPRAPSCDQIIPSMGYVVGNMQWVSVFYNRMKMDLSDAEVSNFMYQSAIHNGWVSHTGE